MYKKSICLHNFGAVVLWSVALHGPSETGFWSGSMVRCFSEKYNYGQCFQIVIRFVIFIVRNRGLCLSKALTETRRMAKTAVSDDVYYEFYDALKMGTKTDHIFYVVLEPLFMVRRSSWSVGKWPTKFFYGPSVFWPFL